MNVYEMEERLRALRVRHFAHYMVHLLCLAICKAVTHLNQNPAAVIVVWNMIPFNMYDDWVQHGQNALVSVAQIMDGYAAHHHNVIETVLADVETLTEEIHQVRSEMYARRMLRRRARNPLS